MRMHLKLSIIKKLRNEITLKIVGIKILQLNSMASILIAFRNRHPSNLFLLHS